MKLGTALLIGPAENCPISSAVQLLIHKLFWASDEGFVVLYDGPVPPQLLQYGQTA